MTTGLKIDDIDPRIAAWHQEWKINRDIVEGERAIKADASRKLYLPMESGLSDAQHAAIVARTPFFPGASRAYEGLLGLIFRKAATVTAPNNALSILETITADYLTVDDLAEEVAGEFLKTNFVGLLVDVAANSEGLSVAQAEAAGSRPFIRVYTAESILGVEAGTIGGLLAPVRVRLQEDSNTILELRFEGGAYTVTKWERVNATGEYVVTDTMTPLRNGQPLPAIPFTLVSTNRRYAPAKAKIADVARLNKQHYIASANLAQCDFFVSHPTPYLFGPKGVASLSLAPGAFISGETKGGDVKIGMLEYSGQAIEQLAHRVTSLNSDMAKVGSRILADEKSAVEAAETMKVKTASENAALASTARLISRKITDALKWVAFWMGLDETALAYEANTDYGSSKLTKDEVAAYSDLWMKGVYSLDTLLDLLIEGEVLPETFDKEADAERRAQEISDRPPVDATIPLTTSSDNQHQTAA